MMTGANPNTGWLEGCLALDDKGFVRVQNVGGFDTRNLFARPVTVHASSGDLPGLIQGNPHAYVGIPLSDGNKNQVVHTSREAFQSLFAKAR